VKWVNQKIINKASKLPWIEVLPGKENIQERGEFASFISENQTVKIKESLPSSLEDSENTSQLKSSLDEILALYNQTISFSDDEENSQIKENQIENTLDEIHQKAATFNDASAEFARNNEPQSNFQKGLINLHYSTFDVKTLVQPSQINLQKPKYKLSDSTENHPNISHTRTIYENTFIVNNENPSIFSTESSSKCNEESEVYLAEQSNDLKTENNLSVLEKENELYDITISNQNIIPLNEKFLMTPITAEKYCSDEFNENESEEDEIMDETCTQNPEIEIFEKEDEIINHQETEELFNALESGDVTFRCSVTPEIKTSSQFHIPFNILKTGTDEYDHSDPVEVQQIIEKLELTLEQFGIEARVIGMQRGPIITRYEVRIPPGIKVNRILSLTDELAMALEALRVRIEAPIPGRSTVGIEIPNKKRSTVLLGDILNHPDYNTSAVRLALPLGKDIAGNLLIEDLCKMPHILIAGATGSGKSVAINAFITSLIITKSPEEVRMLMVDPKLVELSQYNDIPHLLHPVISDAPKAILALNWAVEEMDRRYEDMADMRARDIISYNIKIEQHNKIKKGSDEYIPKMPYIVILIDELGDLMMVAGKEVESSIIRLSQKARAIGIHLILATQRPSVDVITALIKANCPARIALQVAQKTDSRTILDSNGGEQLLGQGDMLFKHPSKAQLIRAQAPYVSDQEVENVVNMVKKTGKPSYIVLEDPKIKTGELELEDENLFDEAWNIIIESNKASASYLQRRLRIGYNRAARIIEAFEARGYIGPQVGSKPREIFIHNH